MSCQYQEICGGCPFRHLSLTEYRKMKTEQFARIAAVIKQDNVRTGTPVFIEDGARRRASMAFCLEKGHLLLGFNARKSHVLADVDRCALLTPKINAVLSQLRIFLKDLCDIKVAVRKKNKKAPAVSVQKGDILLTEAENGLDVLLKTDVQMSLEHRMLICEFVTASENVIRFSTQAGSGSPETIIEKCKPFIIIGGRQVFIPSGTFLQASAAGERALIGLVLRYAGETSGKIADLFCGVGTFSYPFSVNVNNKITAIDSSAELLDGFIKSVHTQMIPNIKIEKRNLFKYPLDAAELKGVELVVFDPPRAGAAAQCAQLAEMPAADKPQKVIAVSCNPHTFVNDANTLIAGGYRLTEMTLVDQFVYAAHSELVALFEKN